MSRSVHVMLDAALAELLRTADRAAALDEASIAAVECAMQIVMAKEQEMRLPVDGGIDAAREALASARAAVLAATCAVRSMDGIRRAFK